MGKEHGSGTKGAKSGGNSGHHKSSSHSSLFHTASSDEFLWKGDIPLIVGPAFSSVFSIGTGLLLLSFLASVSLLIILFKDVRRHASILGFFLK